MKFPFLNRKQYIVLKCYTWHAGVLEQAPMFVGGGAKLGKEKYDTFINPNHNFKTWSRINQETYALPYPIPETRISTNGEDISWANAKNEELIYVDFQHDVTKPMELIRTLFLLSLNILGELRKAVSTLYWLGIYKTTQ